MSSLRRCIVTLVEFGWQFSTVFSNVSSNHLAEQMQSHIGCICLTCLYCASSNVSSYRLLLRMQSHIGFIYLPSPQLASVCFQIACIRGWEVTQIVFVQLLSTRASDMFLWITQFMLTLVTFFELLITLRVPFYQLMNLNKLPKWGWLYVFHAHIKKTFPRHFQSSVVPCQIVSEMK